MDNDLRDKAGQIAKLAAADAKIDDITLPNTGVTENADQKLDQLQASISALQNRVADFEFSAETAALDADGKDANNAQIRAKTLEIRVNIGLRVVSVILAIILIGWFSHMYTVVIVHRPEILRDNIHDEWPKMAFMTGSLLLIGLLTTFLLKSVFSLSTKEPSPNIGDAIKAIMSVFKGNS